MQHSWLDSYDRDRSNFRVRTTLDQNARLSAVRTYSSLGQRSSDRTQRSFGEKETITSPKIATVELSSGLGYFGGYFHVLNN